VDRFDEQSIDLSFRLSEDHAQGRDLCDVSQAGELLKCLLGGFGQSPELADHKKLDGEERVAAGLFVEQLRQESGGFLAAAQSLADQPLEVLDPEGGQHDLVCLRSPVVDRGQRPPQGVPRPDLVVAVRSDQEDVPHVRSAHQAFEPFQSGRVEPLQVVEEEREGMFGGREGAQEALEDGPETVPRFLRWKLRHGRLLPDDKLDFGDQVDNQLAARPQRLEQGTPPTVHLGLALDQDLTHQRLEPG
jgi:hypothetical protein